MSKHCILVRPGESAEGRTGVTYAAGVTRRTAGAAGLSLQLASLPAVAVLTRTDAGEQEDVSDLPQLEDLPPVRPVSAR